MFTSLPLGKISQHKYGSQCITDQFAYASLRQTSQHQMNGDCIGYVMSEVLGMVQMRE